MDNKIVHNFCESRLNNNESPEILNAFTSFFISIIPFIFGFPENIYLYNSSILLIYNGLSSFYYHYYLNYIGKQADEISMIITVYFAIFGLINLKFKKFISIRKKYYTYNLIFMISFIIFNTEIYFDFLFPYIFSIYIIPIIYLIHIISKNHDISYLKELFISFIGVISWIVSEINCNEYTKYGHILWHIFFPLGFYKIILKIDEINRYKKNNFIKL